MSQNDLVVCRDRDRDIYALYQDGDLCEYGGLMDIAIAICDTRETKFSFLDFGASPLANSSAYPETLPNRQSVLSISYGFADKEAAVYVSGSLAYAGDVDAVARCFLNEAGITEIREAVLFMDDSIVPFARLEDVVEGELDTAETDIEELLVEALATLMPFSEFDIVTQSWEFDLPTLAKLPTSTVQSLHKRLMKRGLDNIDASCTILNVCPHQFRSSTIKFFFDDAKFTPIDSTERFDVINEGTPKEFRMALAKRDDFDDSLLTPDDIWKDDSAALLVRFLKSPQVNSEMKEAIARLENERDRPRKTVLDAYESAVATSVGVGL